MSLVFIIEDEPIMAECMALAVEGTKETDAEGNTVHPYTRIFNDAISALKGLQENLPDAILLDVMLVGPDGFAFLHEMSSYTDTARIPVVLVTTLNLAGQDLSHYGVASVLNKATMTPDDIQIAIHGVLERKKSGLAAFNQQLSSKEDNAA